MRISANKRKGDCSELLAAYWLTLAGYQVGTPFGDNAPYDLTVALEEGERPYRIQVKTGKYEGGSITWSAISHGTSGNHNYVGQADYFAVADLKTLKTYLIPVCTCGLRRGTLRIEPLKGKRPLQAIGWAKDFEIVPGTDWLERINDYKK